MREALVSIREFVLEIISQLNNVIKIVSARSTISCTTREWFFKFEKKLLVDCRISKNEIVNVQKNGSPDGRVGQRRRWSQEGWEGKGGSHGNSLPGMTPLIKFAGKFVLFDNGATESLRLDRAETKDDLSSDDVENILRNRKERIVVPSCPPFHSSFYRYWCFPRLDLRV